MKSDDAEERPTASLNQMIKGQTHGPPIKNGKADLFRILATATVPLKLVAILVA